MGKGSTTLVTVACPAHHDTLIAGLWRLFDTKQRTDFFFQLGTSWIRAHRLVVDLFLSPVTFGQYAGYGQPISHVEQVGKDDLATLFHFLYRGTVLVKQEQLDGCQQLARALDFPMFVEALESSCFSFEQPTDSVPITVTCPRHHDALVEGLWRSYTAERGVNFFVRWAGFPMAVHQLVVEAFLDVDNLLERASLEDGTSDVEPGSLDSLVEFMYKGTVDVPKEQLHSLLDMAGELGFELLAEAVKTAMMGAGLPNYVPTTRRLKKRPSSKRGKKQQVNDMLRGSVDKKRDAKRKTVAGKTTGRKTLPATRKSANKDVEGDAGAFDETNLSAAANQECGCIIEQLLEQPFTKRDLETRIRIAKEGRPTPEMPFLVKKMRGFVRHFRVENYKRIDWLAGCPKLNRFFCWPCLLFSSSFMAWDRVGYNDLNNLHHSAARHSRAFTHICSMQTLTVFTTDIVSDPVQVPGSPPTFDSCMLEEVRVSYSNPALDDTLSTPTDKVNVTDLSACELPSGCIIEQLHLEPFKNCDTQRQLAIVNSGRPTPSLPGLFKDSGKGFVRRFNDQLYQKSDWLTGCQKLNQLFCWPCLLFCEETTKWNRQGYNDLNNLYNSIQRHQASDKHISCAELLSKFGDTTESATVAPQEIQNNLDPMSSI